MARATISEVKDIIDTSLTDGAVNTFIGISNGIVTAQLSESGLVADTLKEIERWLAAHLISVTKERMTTEEKIGDAAVKYTGTFGSGLRMTSYGHTVLMLDTSGKLSRLDQKDIVVHAIKSHDR